MHRLLALLLVPYLLSAQHGNHYHSGSVLSASQTASATADTDLVHVLLDLEVTNASTKINGKAILTFHINERIEHITLELTNQLKISQVLINELETTFSHASDELQINHPSGAFGAETHTITINYAGTPNPAANNIFSGINNASSNAWGNQITWTLSEPFNAKMWWPAKQDLHDKIDSADLYITTNSNLKVGSNGLLQSSESLPGNKVRYHWSTRYPMAYYLLAITVGEYVEYNNYAQMPGNTNDSLLIQNYIYNNPETLPYFQDQLDMIPEMMELFCELYGPYPFAQEKYGHVMAPFNGGMEHQTMSSMGIFTFGLNAHELGHQWFGNQVTCAKWNDIWINEGFARFSEYLAAEHLLSSNSAEGTIANDMLTVINQDTGSVYIPDHEPLTNQRIFNFGLTYAKGGLILNMLRNLVNNDEVFFSSLRTFLATYANRTATGEDFRAILEAENGMDFFHFFDQWYYGSGHPVYDISWTKIPGDSLKIVINQSTTHRTRLFTTPLEFHIIYESGQKKRFKILPSENEEAFLIAANGNVKRLIFDPDNWLIKEVDRFVQLDQDGNVILDTTVPKLVELYPNPTNDRVYFTATIPALSVFSSTGQRILEAKKVTELDVSLLKKGLYFVEMRFDSGDSKLIRFIKF